LWRLWYFVWWFKLQGAIICALTYRRYTNITVWYFFVFSHVPLTVGTRNSCYLRTYFLLVPHDLSKSKVFNTVI
jgi:hypothetical protein